MTAGLSILPFALLLVAGCDSARPAHRPDAGGQSPAPSSASPQVPVDGREDEVPPTGASFPASIAGDSGDEQPGSATGRDARMHVVGLRLLPQDGYDRLIVDLGADGVPSWTADYSDEATTAVGEPVQMSGDSFLRIALFTRNGSAEPVAGVAGASGVVAEVRATGAQDGYEEVLIGVRGAPAPFRAFGLTDPGRIVVDIKPAP